MTQRCDKLEFDSTGPGFFYFYDGVLLLPDLETHSPGHVWTKGPI